MTRKKKRAKGMQTSEKENVDPHQSASTPIVPSPDPRVLDRQPLPTLKTNTRDLAAKAQIHTGPELDSGNLNLPQPSTHTASKKRDRRAESLDSATLPIAPTKRPKNHGTVRSPTDDPLPSSTRMPPPPSQQKQSDHGPAAPSRSSIDLPLEIHHLLPKYDFTSMSILSSAKMSQKIALVLSRIRVADSATAAKPGVVVLHAKAAVASKMIGIVEIAKKEIEREGGKWWQYSKLEPKVEEMKPKLKHKPRQNKTTTEITGEIRNAEPVLEGIEAGKEVDGATQEPGEVVDPDNGEVADDNSEEGFETMISPPQRAALSMEKPKVRSVPVMTIFIGRVPLPALKGLFGYVLFSLNSSPQ